MDNHPYWKKFDIEEKRVCLPVCTVCFDFEEPWTLDFNGESICAEIRDKDFSYVVKHGGLAFETGSALDADLRIIKKEDMTEYVIPKVHRILNPS